jgi:hypothetical protein
VHEANEAHRDELKKVQIGDATELVFSPGEVYSHETIIVEAIPFLMIRPKSVSGPGSVSALWRRSQRRRFAKRFFASTAIQTPIVIEIIGKRWEVVCRSRQREKNQIFFVLSDHRYDSDDPNNGGDKGKHRRNDRQDQTSRTFMVFAHGDTGQNNPDKAHNQSRNSQIPKKKRRKRRPTIPKTRFREQALQRT